MQISLNKNWTMKEQNGTKEYNANVPCSVYSVLLENGEMPDPFVGENQYEASKISDRNFCFSKTFNTDENLLSCDRIFLQFEGLDTLATITLNGTPVSKTNNMHRTYRFDVTGLVQKQNNRLEILFASPTQYVLEKQAQRPLHGVATTVPGYPYLRKAHYMFGWDWGPILPDMGIWRNVSLIGVQSACIDDVFFKQKHTDGTVRLTVDMSCEACGATDGLQAVCTLTAPNGQSWTQKADITNQTQLCFAIENPMLWWPRGYGDQPLYRAEISLLQNEQTLDTAVYNIGLRTLTVSTQKDEYGMAFCFVANGVKIFAMGANYIPEDQIIPRCTPDKTRDLLEQCVAANYNCIRVWGGGYYPDDSFFDLCDQLGLIVWQDFMFACAVYRLDPAFEENITAELIDNIKRLRHHASLGLWCGNNENETMWADWGIPQEADLKADYTKQFEQLFAQICKTYDPDRFYWPSSPSCGGGFINPNDSNSGDTHNWDIWHGFKPLTEFRNYRFRFCSEYGFESIPEKKTVLSFAKPEECNLTGPVMEAHQKCDNGNEKLMHYLTQLMPFPKDFDALIYATQMMQADAIRYSVEHMRRFRGQCMGSLYWQVNDTNPVISWSSFDYFHRPKALHYYARRFYAPMLLCVNESDLQHVVVSVSSECRQPVPLTLSWRLRDNQGAVLLEGEKAFTQQALSAQDVVTLDLSKFLQQPQQKRSRVLQCVLTANGQPVAQATALFCPAKHFAFLDPDITVTLSESETHILLTCTAKRYAKGVCLSLQDRDIRLDDNWFDLFPGEPKTVAFAKTDDILPGGLSELLPQITVQSCYDMTASGHTNCILHKEV